MDNLVASENVDKLLVTPTSIALLNMLNSIGPRTKPCRTPLGTIHHREAESLPIRHSAPKPTIHPCTNIPLYHHGSKIMNSRSSLTEFFFAPQDHVQNPPYPMKFHPSILDMEFQNLLVTLFHCPSLWFLQICIPLTAGNAVRRNTFCAFPIALAIKVHSLLP